MEEKKDGRDYLKHLLENPQPDNYLWWNDIDRLYEDLINEVEEADIRLYRIVVENPQNFTQYWNVVEKIGRSITLRRQLIPFILRRKPNIFTRHLLSRWWDELSFEEKFIAVAHHKVIPKTFDEIPNAWLFLLDRYQLKEIAECRPELVPFVWNRLKLSEKERVVKKHPSLVYLFLNENDCEKLRTLWYLSKRKKEFLPLLLLELERSPCTHDKNIIAKKVEGKYPRIVRRLTEYLFH